MKDLMKCHLINYSMVLSPCKNYLAVSNNFNGVQIINLTNQKEECFLKANKNSNGNSYHLNNCGPFLLCTSECYIVAWKWREIERIISGKISAIDYSWKEALPQDSDYLGYLQILSMFVDETEKIVYVGASDGAVHSWKILNDKGPKYLTSVKNLNATAVSLTSGKGFSLIAGCSDGSVRLWDGRLQKECMRMDTGSSEVARPKLGTCVNVVTTDVNSPDWVLCGGEPQLGLWNVRAGKVGVVFDGGDPSAVTFDALMRDEVILAGGTADSVRVWDLSGQLNSEICLGNIKSVYGLLHRDGVDGDAAQFNEFFVCGWGPCVDLYSNVGYRKRTYEC